MNADKKPAAGDSGSTNRRSNGEGLSGLFGQKTSVLADIITLAIVAASVVIFTSLLLDVRGTVAELQRQVVEHDKEAATAATEAKATLESVETKIDSVEARLETLEGSSGQSPETHLPSVGEAVQGLDTESGVMGLIADEYVGKAMYCRDSATNAERIYSHQARVVAVAKGLLARFPCGSQVRVCRLDFPTLCAEDVTVCDVFEADPSDPRKFNTSPAIAAELQYAGSGVAEVTVSRVTKQ